MMDMQLSGEQCPHETDNFLYIVHDCMISYIHVYTCAYDYSSLHI